MIADEPPTARKSARRRGPSGDVARTRTALLTAAAAAFESPGYDQTNTNQIARAAGYSPQTFYRHFPDKLAVFLAVYERWSEAQAGTTFREATAAGAARALVDEHTRSLFFRRTLRLLSVTEPRARAIRTRSRRRQLALLGERFPAARAMPHDALVAWLFAVERLADAIAEGETADLGVSDRAAMRRLTALLGEIAG